MDRIFEISVNKIEHSKSRKVYGKSTMLHRTLLVNTVLNRVRNTERTLLHHPSNSNSNPTSFTNYREPKRVYDMDENESDKPLSYTECQTRCKTKHNTTTQKKKISSLVTLLNSRALGSKTEDFTRHLCLKDDNIDEKENLTKSDSQHPTPRHEKRRCTSDSNDETQHCPKKKLRCIWPNNEVNYSITGLASLFGDLVASTDADKSAMSLNNSNFATAMVAC